MLWFLSIIGIWLSIVWLLHDDDHYETKSGMSNLNIFTRFDNND